MTSQSNKSYRKFHYKDKNYGIFPKEKINKKKDDLESTLEKGLSESENKYLKMKK